MLSFLSIIVIGLFLGTRHATDPDHVIAISTIVIRQHSATRAALIGALWGLGHTATIFAVGTAIIVFDIVIPSRIGLSMELSVGLMLILLGGWNLWEFLRATSNASNSGETRPAFHQDIHVDNHLHWSSPDVHAHGQQQTPGRQFDHQFGKSGIYQFLRPLIVGIVHGLAGSAAVALLILATIRNSMWAITYLLVFGIGTITGMMLITVSFASTFRYLGNKFSRFNRQLALASGLISMAFGLFVAYEICVTQGLFTAHPHWTPQ